MRGSSRLLPGTDARIRSWIRLEDLHFSYTERVQSSPDPLLCNYEYHRMFEEPPESYIMRMIKEFANVLGRLLFNKKKPMYELDVTNRYHVGDDLYTRLCRMADEGKINEAENLLYEEMVPGDMEYLEMALAFYAYLNCFEDEVLHRYHYTRDEIKEGMEDFLDRYGCSDMKELLEE